MHVVGVEVERKYLVGDASWLAAAEGVEIRQGYLTQSPMHSVRVRIAGRSAAVTLKGPTGGGGAARAEWEYSIPYKDAVEILVRVAIQPVIEKTRYRVEHAGLEWEVDVFHGENEGLVIAEVESKGPVESPEAWEPDPKPTWAGQDVTPVSRYLNNRLIERPYREWPEEQRTRADGTVEEVVPDMPSGSTP